MQGSHGTQRAKAVMGEEDLFQCIAVGQPRQVLQPVVREMHFAQLDMRGPMSTSSCK